MQFKDNDITHIDKILSMLFNFVLNIINNLMAFIKINIIYWTCLYPAVQSGNLNLVKYLVSLNKFDILNVNKLQKKEEEQLFNDVFQ